MRAGQSIKIDDYTITPHPVNHSVPAVGYLVEGKAKRRFFYTGDTGPLKDTWMKIGDLQIHCLIIDVSFPDKMKEMAIMTGHLTPRLLAEELLKIHCLPEIIYITHPKPQYIDTIKTQLQKLKIRNLRLLHDGETIRI